MWQTNGLCCEIAAKNTCNEARPNCHCARRRLQAGQVASLSHIKAPEMFLLRDKYSIFEHGTSRPLSFSSSSSSSVKKPATMYLRALPFPEQSGTSRHTSYPGQSCQHQPPSVSPSHCPTVITAGQLRQPHRNCGQCPQAEHPADSKGIMRAVAYGKVRRFNTLDHWDADLFILEHCRPILRVLKLNQTKNKEPRNIDYTRFEVSILNGWYLHAFLPPGIMEKMVWWCCAALLMMSYNLERQPLNLNGPLKFQQLLWCIQVQFTAITKAHNVGMLCPRMVKCVLSWGCVQPWGGRACVGKAVPKFSTTSHLT